jgi:hypothetical protein
MSLLADARPDVGGCLVICAVLVWGMARVRFMRIQTPARHRGVTVRIEKVVNVSRVYRKSLNGLKLLMAFAAPVLATSCTDDASSSAGDVPEGVPEDLFEKGRCRGLSGEERKQCKE